MIRELYIGSFVNVWKSKINVFIFVSYIVFCFKEYPSKKKIEMYCLSRVSQTIKNTYYGLTKIKTIFLHTAGGSINFYKQTGSIYQKPFKKLISFLTSNTISRNISYEKLQND